MDRRKRAAPGGAEEGDGSWGVPAVATPGEPNGGGEDSTLPPRPSPPALHLRPHPVRAGEGTTILFELDRAADVRLRLYDAAGRLAAEILEERLAPGTRRIEWKPRAWSGRELAPGVYFLCIETGEETGSGKVVLIR